MQTINSPEQPKYTELAKNHGKFEILGCYPGYGTTLGNALRRVVLSSLAGAAVRSVKIKGVSHEFSTIEGVMEDVVQIILNLKQIRFKMHGEENEVVKVTLKSKGEGVVTAASIKAPSNVEVVNPDQVIATVTDKKTELEMEIEVDRGLGYVPVESRERDDEREIGVIAIDAIYTPVKRVNYEVENMRVGKRTDYDKITLEIVTDGSVTPVEAFEKSVSILVGQFSSLTQVEKEGKEAEAPAALEAEAGEEVVEKKAKKVTKKKKTEETE
jgi:DNA-directed RNA polymerase subunit alpha